MNNQIPIERIRAQLALEGTISFSKLLGRNFHYTDKEELSRVLDILEAMKEISRVFSPGGEQEIIYKGNPIVEQQVICDKCKEEITYSEQAKDICKAMKL